MTANADESAPAGDTPVRGRYVELLQGGRALYTALIIGGVALHATQILVIAIIMPTVVADIGGAVYYTWAAMLYTIGGIVGATSTGGIWARFGARKGYALGAAVFALSTAACALAPDMATLIAARSVQGWAGGLVAGGGTALITTLYDARLRTRILAMWQGAFAVCHLAGPVVGGSFAAIGWWRGSFWLMVPFMLLFSVLAWLRIPESVGHDAGREAPPFPLFRLALLTLGVLSVAATGPISNMLLRVALFIIAIALVTLFFRLDARATNRLYPSNATSLSSPVGLALLILALHAMCQTTVTLFLPLLLQIVHGISPVFVNFVTIVISLGWTAGTFTVSGWSGDRERVAMFLGPLLSLAALMAIATIAQADALIVMTITAFVMGLGPGVFNVHLVARTMENAPAGEQRTTAAALASIRGIGTAFGAAFGGVIAHAAGLGNATDPTAVGHAVTVVYWICCIPLALAALAMTRLLMLEPAGRKRTA
ncbi:MAG: MFS transporter [Hyphomicrobiaceae bacterium]